MPERKPLFLSSPGKTKKSTIKIHRIFQELKSLPDTQTGEKKRVFV